jgi:glycosyltransferase involved in cell wall biosynthesis
MTSLPRVVALMPTYNGERFVGETLAALAAQTYTNLEIVISDDASTDGTALLCECQAATDARFRLVRQTSNLGWIGNANYLIRAARGDYAFFAFHDDPPAPAYVSRLVEALEAHPEAVLAFSDIVAVGEEQSYGELDNVTDRVERARRILLRRGRWWLPNRGVFRLAAAKQIGGMRKHLAGEYEADHPWLLRLALLGAFVRVPEVLIHKAYREDSVSGKWNRRPRAWHSAAIYLETARQIRLARPTLGEQIAMYRALGRLGAWALIKRQVF